MSPEEDNWRGYEWTALSVTTVGALLASIQGSALLTALWPLEVDNRARVVENEPVAERCIKLG